MYMYFNPLYTHFLRLGENVWRNYHYEGFKKKLTLGSAQSWRLLQLLHQQSHGTSCAKSGDAGCLGADTPPGGGVTGATLGVEVSGVLVARVGGEGSAREGHGRRLLAASWVLHLRRGWRWLHTIYRSAPFEFFL